MCKKPFPNDFFHSLFESLINHQSFVTELLFYLRLIETQPSDKERAISPNRLFALANRIFD